MIRVKWDLDEAVALCDLYIKSGKTINIDENSIEALTVMLNKRAHLKGLVVDDKFRNHHGISMQIRCLHFVATDGKEGLANGAKIFYEAYDLYVNHNEKFCSIVDDFYLKYS